MADFKVGQTIETNDGRQGIIRFVGDIHVAEGHFLGVELPTATGKNDGSVQGERYFQCAPGRGLFVRPSGVSRILAQPAPPKPKPAARASLLPPKAQPARPPPTKPSRPSSTDARPPSKRLSVVSPPASSSRPAPAPSSTRAPARKSSVSGVSTTTSTTARSTRTTPQHPVAPSSATSKASALASTDDTRVRVLEKQLAESLEKAKNLDQVSTERDKLQGIVQKLTSKTQELRQENNELKTQGKEVGLELERLSRVEAEAESIYELATLDREMAEERADQAEQELESLRSRLEEQELELEIARNETEMLTQDMTMDEKEAAGYYRLESERDRLRNALLRLKELTDENEAAHKSRIQELESDLANLEDITTEKTRLESENLTLSSTIEDIRQQLDAANTAEEMIEELSDQNQRIKDQLAQRDLIIRDLENIKELNDELEIHHVEEATELRAELEVRESELAEQTHKAIELDATIADQETLITKFRDLVLDLQSKMTDAQSSKVMSEEQAKDVTGRFNEVMELNRRLRTANLTSTVKTITSELQKLQAEEAQEELEIVKHYLPESPELYKNDSLRSYFRAKRIGFKANLTGTLMRATGPPSTGSTDSHEQAVDDILRLDAVYQLTFLDIRSNRFWPAVSSASIEQFMSFGRAHEDMDPIEKTLEKCLESLKKDEVNHQELTDSLRRSNEILRGIASDFSDALAARPEDEIVFRASSIKAHFELIKDAFKAIKASIEGMEVSDDESEEDGPSITEKVAAEVTPYIEASNSSILAVGKLLRTLKNLRDDSLYPRFPSGDEEIVQQDTSLALIAQAVQKFAKDVIRRVVPGPDTGSMSFSEVLGQLDLLQTEYLRNGELLELGTVASKLNGWNDFASVLMNNVEIEHGPAPWVVKAQEIEARKRQAVEAERQLHVLTQEHHATVLQIREREEIIDTKELEIEHLKAKHREAVGKVEDLGHLQSELSKAETERKDLHARVKAQEMELQRLREFKSVSERSEAELQPETPSRTNEAPVQPTQQVSAAFSTYVSALTNENQWLRTRENRDFNNTLQSIFTAPLRDSRAKEARRYKESKADEMLSKLFSLEGLNTSTHTEALPPSRKGAASVLVHHTTPAPLLLSRDVSRLWYEDLEDDLFEDLEPIAEAFEGMGGFEGFGEAEVKEVLAY
ncbi:dynein associated protein-domain-containing protein [Lophiotrema nucula]|uniref:Dynein associated protein-domain-containing protein n=1 Tax=Lophiotrema nucula TaxID=690887 RepID=A0A6A5Z8S8_9PLEO|nr:dynein associated protein-domain-containing protein [Lophiotrema nucula]